jgi:hypothetical protein
VKAVSYFDFLAKLNGNAPNPRDTIEPPADWRERSLDGYEVEHTRDLTPAEWDAFVAKLRTRGVL